MKQTFSHRVSFSAMLMVVVLALFFSSCHKDGDSEGSNIDEANGIFAKEVRYTYSYTSDDPAFTDEVKEVALADLEYFTEPYDFTLGDGYISYPYDGVSPVTLIDDYVAYIITVSTMHYDSYKVKFRFVLKRGDKVIHDEIFGD